MLVPRRVKRKPTCRGGSRRGQCYYVWGKPMYSTEITIVDATLGPVVAADHVGKSRANVILLAAGSGVIPSARLDSLRKVFDEGAQAVSFPVLFARSRRVAFEAGGFADLAQKPLFPAYALAFRRDGWLDAGGFNADLPNLWGWDFALRLALVRTLRPHMTDPVKVDAVWTPGMRLEECLVRDRFIQAGIANGDAGPGIVLAAARRDALLGERASQAVKSLVPGLPGRWLGGFAARLAAG